MDEVASRYASALVSIAKEEQKLEQYKLAVLSIKLRTTESDIGLSLSCLSRRGQIDLRIQQLLLIVGERNGFSVKIRNQGFAGEIHLTLQSDPVTHGDVDAVLKGLNFDFPLEQLRRLIFCVGGWNQDQFCSEQSLGADALGIVPVKADHNPDASDWRMKNLKALLGRGIIVLLVKLRALGDVYHLLLADDFTLTVNQKTHVVCISVLADIKVWNSINGIFPTGVAYLLNIGML